MLSPESSSSLNLIVKFVRKIWTFNSDDSNMVPRKTGQIKMGAGNSVKDRSDLFSNSLNTRTMSWNPNLKHRGPHKRRRAKKLVYFLLDSCGPCFVQTEEKI